MRGTAIRRPWRWMGMVALMVVGLLPTLASPVGAAGAPVHFPNAPLASWRADGVAYTTLVTGNTVYVGGSFSTVRSPDGRTVVSRTNLAAFDVRNGALLPAFTANANGVVRRLAVANGRLYVGGSFTAVNGVARGRVAAVNPTTGAVDTGFRADTNSNVYAMAVGGSQLFLGGSFSTVNSITRTRAASVLLTTGAVTPYAPVMDNTVSSIASDASGSAIYLGGPFTMLNGVAAPWLAKTNAIGQLQPIRWERLYGPALDLEVSDDGSRLAVAQGGAGNLGAWYDSATGASTWRQWCDGDAQAVHVVDGTMFTGFHEACEGDTTQRFTANATATGARDPLFRPTFDRFYGVFGIDGDAGHVVIAGDFTNISGVSVRGFAIFTNAAPPPTTTTTTQPPVTTTTTRPPTTTTTTTAPPTTTTTTAPPPGTTPYFTSTFTAPNNAAWSSWVTSAASGSVSVQGNAGRLAVNDAANAFARATVSGPAAQVDQSVTFSYRWSATSGIAYFNVYARGSGGWMNAYRPRSGYGLEFASSSSTVTVRKVDNGTLSTLRSVAGAQVVSTQKQWVRLRVVGSTIQFKTWLDGQAEPAAWRATNADAGVTGAGQLSVSVVRGSSNVGAKDVTIDDVAISRS